MPDQCSLSSFHFVIGFPASRKLFKIDHIARRIHQYSFQVQTSPPNPRTYDQEGLSSNDHVLVEFDRRRMMDKGQMHTAPDPKGISGGGIFYIDKQTELGPLVAIATEHRSKSRLMVGTRIKHFLNAARRLNLERPELFELDLASDNDCPRLTALPSDDRQILGLPTNRKPEPAVH